MQGSPCPLNFSPGDSVKGDVSADDGRGSRLAEAVDWLVAEW